MIVRDICIYKSLDAGSDLYIESLMSGRLPAVRSAYNLL